MTSLYIGYPDIPSRATNWKTYTNSTSEDPNELDFNPAYNTFRGEKHHCWGSSYKKPDHALVNDLGSGNERSASFLYVANMKQQRIVAGANFDIKLDRSSDDSTYTNVSSEACDSVTLIGSRSEDYFKSFTQTSSYRYWRTRFPTTGGGNVLAWVSKIYFGNLFDMGTDSYTYDTNIIPAVENDFKTSTGSVYPVRVGLPYYQINITWTDVTDVKMKSFQDEISNKRHNTPVFLYTSDIHEVLDNKRLIFGKIDAVVIANVDNIPDRNQISISFKEAVG